MKNKIILSTLFCLWCLLFSFKIRAQSNHLSISLKSGISLSAFTKCQGDESNLRFMSTGLVLAPKLNFNSIDYGLDVSFYHAETEIYFGYGVGIERSFQIHLQENINAFSQSLFARLLLFDKKFFMWIEPGIGLDYRYRTNSNQEYTAINDWDFQLSIGPALGYKLNNGYSVFINFNWFWGLISTHTTHCLGRVYITDKLKSLGTYKGIGIAKSINWDSKNIN